MCTTFFIAVTLIGLGESRTSPCIRHHIHSLHEGHHIAVTPGAVESA
uniref:Uncharacterized protein n=1 Tax=Anopheles dirus TaxID=7168 RepID=A0A182NXT8_9DIPT